MAEVGLLAARTRVMSRSSLLPRAMSVFLILTQLMSMLMSMTHVAAEATVMPRVWATTHGHAALGPC